MKKVQIERYERGNKKSLYIRHRMHKVYFGDGKFCYFNNIKEANVFIAQTNKFINNILHQCNAIYYNVFAEYRRNFFIFSENPEFAKCERDIKEAFYNIDRSFDTIVMRPKTENYNAFVMQDLKHIIEDCFNVCEKNIYVLRERKEYAGIFQIEIYLELLTTVKNKIESWGKEYFIDDNPVEL